MKNKIKSIILKFQYTNLQGFRIQPRMSSNFKIVFDTTKNTNISLSKFDEENAGELHAERVLFNKVKDTLTQDKNKRHPFESDRLFIDYTISTAEFNSDLLGEQIMIVNGKCIDVIAENCGIALTCIMDVTDEKNLNMRIVKYDNDAVKTELISISADDEENVKEFIVEWL